MKKLRVHLSLKSFIYIAEGKAGNPYTSSEVKAEVWSESLSIYKFCGLSASTGIRPTQICNNVLDNLGPDKVEDNLPDYPGFEQDVFKVIKDYFQSLAEPLLTFTMYEVFTNVFGENFFSHELLSGILWTYD